ncbi:uncharacterized protein Z519_04272 [Cladophialophora bantiana CBS 173.52]|uniref:Uncharacterized protein n=1 Tax=Cladophialophora bantiana (strain ATCC 10958 / CBS 173.52 / CDC B-1940 / NIH 8579) TaxID=1442370 RepID=A0A0D2GAS6_CLAB1|nr:uncharacterized protein Z519_04272 [Cladophialophora bantiana CBS 173.52]KIW95687.1 hypothetical protein Z519_04272 [Cladophialophora bantiana CBS 173.52]
MNPLSTENTSAHRRSSSSSSLPAPLQNLVDKAEKERDLYEDPWSRAPGPQTSEQVQPQQPKQSSKVEQDNNKKSFLRKPRLPGSLQRLVDRAEVDREVYEDPWSRM